jgi:hypothetical protein
MSENLTLSSYLEKRGKQAKALTRGEAEAFGIPYPLQTGWPRRHGEMEITPTMIADAAFRVAIAKQEARDRAKHAPTKTQASHAKASPIPGFALRQAKRYQPRNSTPR